MFARIMILAACTALSFAATAVNSSASDFWSKEGLDPSLLSATYTTDGSGLLLYSNSPRSIVRYTISTGVSDTLLFPSQAQDCFFTVFNESTLLCYNEAADGSTATILSLPGGAIRCTMTFEALWALKAAAFGNNGNEIITLMTGHSGLRFERRNALTGDMISAQPMIPTRKNPFYGQWNISNDGETVYMISMEDNQRYLELWQVSTGEHVVYPVGKQTVLGDISVSGSRFAWYKEDTITVVQDIQTGATVAELNKQRGVPMRLEADGRYLATLARSTPEQKFYTLQLYDIDTEQQQFIPFQRKSSLSPSIQLQFSPDGSTFTVTQTILATCPLIGSNSEVSTTSHNQYAATVHRTSDGAMLGWSPSAGHLSPIVDIAISSDGLYVASSDEVIGTILRDASSGDFRGRLASSGSLAFSPDSKSLWRARSDSALIEKISLPSMTAIQKFPATTTGSLSLHFSPAEDRVMSRSAAQIALYRYPSLTPQREFKTTTGSFVAAEFSQTDNSIIALQYDSTRKTELIVRKWNAETGVELPSLIITEANNELSDFLLSPDASLLLASTSTSANIRRTSDGGLVHTFPYNAVAGHTPLAFSPDGLYLIRGRIIKNETNQHAFSAISIGNPAGDFQFDAVVQQSGHIGKVYVHPSGNTILYTQPTCAPGRLNYVALNTFPTVPISSHKSYDINIYTGDTLRTSMGVGNVAPAPIVIDSIAISKPDLPFALQIDYGGDHALPDTLQISSSASISIYATSTYRATAPFDILVYYSGRVASGVLRIPGSANFVAPADISLSEAPIDFGNVAIGKSKDRFIVVRHFDASNLFLESMTIEPPNAEVTYTLNKTLPVWLPQGVVADLRIIYTPTTNDTLNSDFVVRSNVTDKEVLRIPLRGRGIGTVGIGDRNELAAIAASVTPNPATSVAHIRFNTAVAGAVHIQIFSAEGRLVAELPSAVLGAGAHDKELSVEGLPRGVYFCRITTASGVETTPLLVVP